ncbi:hypothetical protein NP493_46g06001 [Ridgeia piscesae]|uniref:P/Homo B domain-containing protein n=1 Tax=Ridgeia piscesae TaxID=27915 RepID=A0AAD9PC18_RIDPI|nr:hypothetical protein NP493_46g06001 [Ridgeia piscesae]
MVDLAADWKSVSDRFHCTAGQVLGKYEFSTAQSMILTITTDACKGLENQVNYLEHVQSFVTLKSSRRGDVTLFLVSPMNTTSMILSKRPKDTESVDGFNKWPFMTTHMWAENARGTWKLVVVFDSEAPQQGVLFEWTLMLHGTQLSPYVGQKVNVTKRHPKLGVVKREHEEGVNFQFQQ